MTTADDYTISYDVAQDLNMSGDLTWTALRNAEDDETDATLEDGTVIPCDDIDTARTALVGLVLARLTAAGEAHGWIVEDYNPMSHDTQWRTLHAMGDEGDDIAEILTERGQQLWGEIEDPTGAEILAAM